MIASRFCRVVGIALGLFLVTSSTRGDALLPWTGASATAGSVSQTGATASAQDKWSRLVEYSSAYYPRTGGYFVSAQGSSSASAGGSSDSLLHVTTQASIENPGTTGGGVNGGSADASASWSNDFVRLTPPASGTMPDSIRLQFSLTFKPADLSAYQGSMYGYTQYGHVTVRANDTTIGIYGAAMGHIGYDPENFDTITDGPAGTKVGTFHLDLPVDKSGMSAVFSLLLAASSPAQAESNTKGQSYLLNDILALKDVTLADGTSLAMSGYGVSFASGLTLPQPTPEPSTIAIWSIVALGGAWGGRHWSRR